VGETFAMAVLYNLTRKLDPILAFSITAAVIGGLGIIVLLFVVEPESIKDRVKKWKVEVV
jgi:hypothetical protein